MEENLDKLFDYRPLIPGSGRFASIVGIGGGAGKHSIFRLDTHVP